MSEVAEPEVVEGTAIENGKTPELEPSIYETVEFPLGTFKDAARHLRRPFTPAAVKFKVQATWPKAKPTGGLIVAYIDARLVVERLNLIVPHLWFDEYEALGGQHMVCRLTVDGITRQDVGEGTGKGLYSDALKRAAVKFGIGVSLYAIPKMILQTSDGTLKLRKDDKLELTPKGEGVLRGMYEHWLASHGSHAFAPPLDHGDVHNAQGDAEVDEATGEIIDPAAAKPDDTTKPLPAARIAELKKAREAADLDDQGLKMLLVDLGVRDTGQNGKPVPVRVMKSLSSEQADQLEQRLSDIVDQKAAAA